MGLLDKLTTTGTPYSYNNGTTPITNPGATTLSKLHVDGNQPSYSINGANFADVNTAFQAYNDGFINSLPQPSQLDLDGATPPKYTDSLPG
jgi:hypothetical protein